MERRELEALFKAIIHLDIECVLHRGQDLSEERLEVFFVEVKAPCLAERPQGGNPLRTLLHRVLIKNAFIGCIGNICIRRQRLQRPDFGTHFDGRAFPPLVFQLEINRERLMHDMDIDGLFILKMHLDGGIPHDGQEFAEQCRRQLEPLLIEQEIAIAVIRKARAILHDFALRLLGAPQEPPKLFRRLIRKFHMARVQLEPLAELDDVAICHLLEEVMEIAQYIEFLRADAEFQPARNLAILRHGKEARYEMNVRLGLRRDGDGFFRCKKLQQALRIARTILLLAADNARTAPRAPTMLPLHDFKQRCNDMLARTVIQFRCRAGAAVVFHISMFINRNIDMIFPGALDIRIISERLISVKFLHAPVPIVAAAALICCIARHRADIDLAEQILSLRLCAPAHSMLK